MSPLGLVVLVGALFSMGLAVFILRDSRD